MNATNPPPWQPVEELARQLVRHARTDPTLLARSVVGALPARGSPAWPAPRVPATPPAPPSQELEELVSIAVACARRAEDVCRTTSEVGQAMRRRLTAAVALVSLVVIGAAAAIVMEHRGQQTQGQLAEVASTVHAIDNRQRQTTTDLAAMRFSMAVLRDDAASRSAGAVAQEQAAIASDRSGDAVPAPLPPAINVPPHVVPPELNFTQASAAPAVTRPTAVRHRGTWRGWKLVPATSGLLARCAYRCTEGCASCGNSPPG